MRGARPPPAALVTDLSSVGKTMADEWVASGGEGVAEIMRAYRP